jgi:hypothetical protein
MTAAFIITTGWNIHNEVFFSMNFLEKIPGILIISLIAAGAGKGIGLLYARIMYKRIYNQLNKTTLNQKMEEPYYAGNMD